AKDEERNRERESAQTDARGKREDDETGAEREEGDGYPVHCRSPATMGKRARRAVADAWWLRSCARPVWNGRGTDTRKRPRQQHRGRSASSGDRRAELLGSRRQPFRDTTMARTRALAMRGVRVQAVLALGNRARGIIVLTRARLAGGHAARCFPAGSRGTGACGGRGGCGGRRCWRRRRRRRAGRRIRRCAGAARRRGGLVYAAVTAARAATALRRR